MKMPVYLERSSEIASSDEVPVKAVPETGDSNLPTISGVSRSPNDRRPVNLRSFFEAIFRGYDSGFLEVRQFRIDSDWRGQDFCRLPIESLPNLCPDIADVYFGPAPRVRKSGKAEDVERTQVLWLDVDAKCFEGGKEDAWQVLGGLGEPAPSMIVDTGHGYHAYWLLHEPMPIEYAQVVMEALRVKIDPKLDKVSDASRVMRVPGTINHKNEEDLPVEIVLFEPERRFAANDFDRLLEPFGPEEPCEQTFSNHQVQLLPPGEPVDPAIVLRGAAEGKRNFALFTYACSLLGRGFQEDEALLLVTAAALNCSPPYPSDASEEPVEKMVPRVYETYPAPSPSSNNASYFDRKTFIPLRLARGIKANGVYVFGFDRERGTGRLMEYGGGVWRPAVNVDVEAQARLGEDVRRARVDEAIAALKRDVPRRSWLQWNRNRRLINCLNGMLDPLTLELEAHDPGHYSTMQIPVVWNPDAGCERLDRFLEEVLPEDCIPLAHMMLGYLLIPDITADKLFVLLGRENTGKTTFLSTVQELLGETNVVVASLQDLAGNRFATAQLENKLLCVFDDLDNVPLKSASIPKVLTGGFPTFRVEHKGQDAYDAPLYARMLFTCNEMPTSPDKTGAWYRRVCLLPFAEVIHQKDRDLVEKLTTPESLQRLLTLAVRGLQALIENGMQFPEPPSIAEAMAAYKAQNDSVMAFVQEECELGEDYRVSRGEWYRRYCSWCEHAGRYPVSRRKAYRRLETVASVGQIKGDGGIRCFKGIGLASTPSPALLPALHRQEWKR